MSVVSRKLLTGKECSAQKDAILPLATPCKSEDGESEIDHLCIRKGQNLIIAFGSCNRMKSIWGPDAYEWKPERWLKPLLSTVAEARIPGIYPSLYVVADWLHERKTCAYPFIE